MAHASFGALGRVGNVEGAPFPRDDQSNRPPADAILPEFRDERQLGG